MSELIVLYLFSIITSYSGILESDGVEYRADLRSTSMYDLDT